MGRDVMDLYSASRSTRMVHASAAYARMRNRLQAFACTASIGPGASNMVTGAALATINRLPVLLLPGDTFTSRLSDPVLQQVDPEQPSNPVDRQPVAQARRNRQPQRRVLLLGVAERPHDAQVIVVEQAAELLLVLEQHFPVRQVHHPRGVPVGGGRVVGDRRERLAQADGAGSGRDLQEFARVLGGEGGRGGEQRGDGE